MSEICFEVRYFCGLFMMASFKIMDAFKSVWMSMMLSSDLFLTHFRRTFVIVRIC